MRTKWMALIVGIVLGGNARAQQVAPLTHAASDAGARQTAPEGSTDESNSTGGLDKSFTANQVVGKIQALGTNRDTVTLEVSGTSQHYKLGSGTTVFVEGRLGSASDLKEGQQVRAAFETLDGAKTVRWIEVTPAAATVPAQEAPPAGVHAPDNETGIVASVDFDSKQLVLRYGLMTTSVLLNNATVVTQGGSVVPTHDLKPGMRVRATLDATRSTATRIDILPEH